MSVRDAVNCAVKLASGADDALAASMRRKAYLTAAQLGLIGLGAGAAVRSAQGLGSLASRKKNKPSAHEPVPVEVPVLAKAAALPLAGGNKVSTPDLWPRTNYSFDGQGAAKPSDIAWYYPLIAASLVGGAYAGHKGLDTMLDKRRQQSVDEDLAQAKSKYEKTLRASANTKLASSLEKLALSLGELLGLYATGALVTGAGAASYGYANAQANSKRKVLEDAAKARRQQLRGSRPPVMYAVPKPVSASE